MISCVLAEKFTRILRKAACRPAVAARQLLPPAVGGTVLAIALGLFGVALAATIAAVAVHPLNVPVDFNVYYHAGAWRCLRPAGRTHTGRERYRRLSPSA